MRAGTISDIIAYFFQNPASDGDIDRALREFFKIKSVHELPVVAPDFADGSSPAHRYFHEWFIYDFKLVSGRTPLREWYEGNPAGMSPADMTVYADLLRENEYGFFKVISSVPGRVEVESFANGKRYTVREYSAAPFLRIHEAITARVGRVGERYEFVGGLVGSMHSELSDNVGKLYTHPGKPITPKEIYHLWYAPNRGKPKKGAEEETFGEFATTVAEAKTRLQKAMKACDVLPFISIRRVIAWIQNTSEETAFSPAALLIGLANEDASGADVDELMKAVMALNNTIRREEPPQYTDAELAELERKPRFRHDIMEPLKWHQIYGRGIEQMKRGKIEKALALFDRAFGHLLDQRTTTREVYRLFANKGVCMIALNEIGGRYFIELALKLNPNYDFARESLAQHDRELARLSRHKDKEVAMAGMLAPLLVKMTMQSKNAAKMLALENDPAQRYYVWLKPLGINFSRHAATPTKRTKIKLKQP